MSRNYLNSDAFRRDAQRDAVADDARNREARLKSGEEWISPEADALIEPHAAFRGRYIVRDLDGGYLLERNNVTGGERVAAFASWADAYVAAISLLQREPS